MPQLRRRVATMAIPLGLVAALSSAAAVVAAFVAAPRALGAARATRIEVGVVGRWDACALLECLAPYRSFLIQHGADRWVVHAQTPGCNGEDMKSAVAAIEECLDERGIAESFIRIDGKPHRAAATAGSLS